MVLKAFQCHCSTAQNLLRPQWAQAVGLKLRAANCHLEVLVGCPRGVQDLVVLSVTSQAHGE